MVEPQQDEQRTTHLDELTGVRSEKRSFYPEYLRSNQRLENTVRALDRISGALVRTTEGPRALVEAVLRAAAEHLRAHWLLFAVADGTLQATRPRYLLLAGGTLLDDVAAFPAEPAQQLQVLRCRPWEAEPPLVTPDCVRVSMTLDGEPVGGIAGCPAPGVRVDDTDLALLHVLANQAAVALYNSSLVHATTRLRGRTEQLSAAAQRHAKDLASRNAELQETQRMLSGALQRQVLDEERHRIARELHDSVTQDVLSAGMTVEVCRAELDGGRAEPGAVAERLDEAKQLTRHAVQRLRTAIYALHDDADEPPGSLPALLERLSTAHLPGELNVSVTVRGEPLRLPAELERALLRITGEALFNTISHSNAGRSAVRLQYRPDRIVLTVSDDGDGDPEQVRRKLRLAATADLGGRHQGLANMLARMDEFGGDLAVRRSGMGGIMLRLRVPLPLPAARAAG